MKRGQHKKATATLAPLRGFHPDTFVYHEVVPFGRPVPRLVASCADRRARVHVSQAAGVPGTAQISVTGPDGITQTYIVYFTRPA